MVSEVDGSKEIIAADQPPVLAKMPRIYEQVRKYFFARVVELMACCDRKQTPESCIEYNRDKRLRGGHLSEAARCSTGDARE